MRVCVIGAGVIGLASAYVLVREGHEVTVVDRLGGSALATSYANGGQLSYSYVAPFASPGVLHHLPHWLLDRDAPTRFRPRLDPAQWRWIAKFLRACTTARSRETTERLLDLAFLSRDVLHEAVDAEGLAFDFVRNGKLVVFSEEESFGAARAQMAYQAELGCEQQDLSPAECLRLEPALEPVRRRLVGGIHTPSEEAGDCRLFTRELEALLKGAGTRFVYNAEIRHLEGNLGRLSALATTKGDIAADAFVLAAGTGSAALAGRMGMRLDVYPLRGFSQSMPVTDPGALPALSVTDFDRKTVYARIGRVFRAAAMADLTGYSTHLDRRRLSTLTRHALETFPEGADYERASAWCGLRPATPTGLPVISATRLENLFVNTGHGALGFTLAMGSARLLADLIARRDPAIPAGAFALAS